MHPGRKSANASVVTGLAVSRPCELSGLLPSTYYDPAPVATAPGEVLVRIKAICDEFEWYGYRRVGAALRHQVVMVNNKKLRRLMREHDLHPEQRRGYVATTDSDHASLIFKNLTKGLVLERPNQLWIAGLTADVVLPKLNRVSIATALGGGVTPANQFCCNGGTAIAAFARRARIAAHVLPMPGKPNPKAPDFHLNNVNAYHGRLKQWLRRFMASPPKTYRTTSGGDAPWRHWHRTRHRPL
jgi:hypothetical protein